jgi:quinol monooxygenase YgiN
MIKAFISYGVPVEKQEEYFKFVREELKPKFEANGCRSYNIFREVDKANNTDLVTPEKLVSEIAFDDAAAMDKLRAQFKSEPWKSLLERYHSWQTPGSIEHYISQI